MDLLSFLTDRFTGQTVRHKSEALYELFSSEAFRLFCYESEDALTISYLSVTIKGARYGDFVVRQLLDYCKMTGRTAYASRPEPKYYRFWRRSGFGPKQPDDLLWIYEAN